MPAPPTPNPSVGDAFDSIPAAVRRKLLALRRLIYETAGSTEGVGRITETLKWGQPAYLTEESGSGTTIRLGWNAGAPTQYAMYVHCQTNLIDNFRGLFPNEFTFEGNRALIFEQDDSLPKEPLAHCIAMALTYHLRKAKTSRGRRIKRTT